MAARRTGRFPTHEAVTLRAPPGPSLRRLVTGTVRAGVEELAGRPAMVVRSVSSVRRGALSIEDGKTIGAAATAACGLRIPMVLVLSSSGADVSEGVASLHGWGQAARALARCSGVVPVVVVVTGTGPVGAGLPPRAGRPGGHDQRRLRLRVRPGHGRGLHRHPHRHPPARWHGDARALERPVRRRGGFGEGRAGPRGAPPRPAARPCRRAGTGDAGRRPGRPRRRRAARAHPDPGHELLRRPSGRRRVGRRRGRDRALDTVVAAAGDGLRPDRRPQRRLHRQPAPGPGRHPRHHRLAEGGPVRPILRRLQHPTGHPGRHAGLPAGQGPRVARDDPPRSRARLRLCRGHRPPGLRHPAQGVRWRLHRHGLQGPRQRPLLSPGPAPRSR